mgnify:CR=1 FL=1
MRLLSPSARRANGAPPCAGARSLALFAATAVLAASAPSRAQAPTTQPAVPVADMILAGVRDTDPLEQELIGRLKVPQLTVADLRTRGEAFRRTYAALSARVSRIYVHIDMDVLDPGEVRGHSLSVPEGPASVELAAAIERMFRHPKAGAIGIASLPFGERDKDGLSLMAAYRLIEGAGDGTPDSGIVRHSSGWVLPGRCCEVNRSTSAPSCARRRSYPTRSTPWRCSPCCARRRCRWR